MLRRPLPTGDLYILHPLKLRWRWLTGNHHQFWEEIYLEKVLKLVGGWTNPFEKYARQVGSFPQVGVKIKHVWNHHPEKWLFFSLSCWFWRGLLSWIPSISWGTLHSNTHKWSPSGPTKQIWTRKLLLKCTGTHLGHLWCCHCTNDGHFTARSARSKTYRRPERWPLILQQIAGW